MMGINRLQGIGYLMALGAILIVVQLVRIQTNVSAQKYSEVAAQTYNYETKVITPERGNIYDRWGSLLAGNTKVYEVGVSRNELGGEKNRETIARAAADILGLNYTEVLRLINGTYEEDGLLYVTLGSNFTPEQVNQLIELNRQYEDLPTPPKGQVNPSLRGMHWVPSLRRSYPEGRLASNVLGFYYYGGGAGEQGGYLGV